MTNYFVGITAYERPQRLMRLLTQLRQQRNVRLDIHVAYDDPSPPATIRQTVQGKGELVTPNVHLGRDNYWRLVNMLWTRARTQSDTWERFLFVQDDISIEDPYTLDDANAEMEMIEREVARVAAFNLYGDGPDCAAVSRWTGRPVVHMENGYVFAHWVDMPCVVFTKWATQEIPALTMPDPDRKGDSPGVGRQISRSLDNGRYAQIMAPAPWVKHRDGGQSKMHPERTEEEREILLHESDL